MLTFTRINTRHPQYVFVEKLLHQSFPLEERRDDAEQRNNTDHNASFFCYLIEENKNETEEKKVITLDEIRAELTSFARKGFTSDIRDIITGFGANKLSELDPKHYEEVLSRVRDIANGR